MNDPRKNQPMQLIGMLDSPYVRRVAISLQLLGLDFEHRPISVFRTFDQFRQINPVVKAPTLVCDDGTVLMDSTLILEYAEALSRSRKSKSGSRSLLPTALPELQRDLRVAGLALAACEKSVQVLYEGMTRPPEKRHEPWLARVTGQMLAAYEALNLEVGQRPLDVTNAGITQGAISAAVAWHFTQRMQPELVPADDFPGLVALSGEAEALEEFRAAPYGDSTYQTPR